LVIFGFKGVAGNEDGGAVDGWECAVPIKPKTDMTTAIIITSMTRPGAMHIPEAGFVPTGRCEVDIQENRMLQYPQISSLGRRIT
jgi:hypothetical protein